MTETHEEIIPDVDARAHGAANWNEIGPQANPPRPNGRMKTARAIVGIVAACILGGCSMPYQVILHNRSHQMIVVELPDGAKTTIEAGSVAEFVFNESFMQKASRYHRSRKIRASQALSFSSKAVTLAR